MKRRKYQREMTDVCSNEPGNRKITLKFDDLCTDVIDMIVCNMQLQDLMNISDTSKQLRTVAGSVFSRKYAHFLILLINDYLCGNELELSKNDMIISIWDVKTWFKLMRNFGAYIKHVRILSYDCKKNLILLEKVFDFCSDSLETLVLDGYRMLSVRKPLTALQEFSFSARCFRSSEALELMPNLRRLRLGGIPMTLAKTYAKVERLDVAMGSDEEVHEFISLIHLNRQIKHLIAFITFYCRPEHNHLIYSSIADNLGQLTTLKLIVCNKTEVRSEYRFKTVKSFLLATVDRAYPGNMFQFDDLKKIALAGTSKTLPFCVNFAKLNKKVKILKLNYVHDQLLLNTGVYRDLVKELPELEQFVVLGRNDASKSTVLNHLGGDWEPFDKPTSSFKKRSINSHKMYRFRRIASITCASLNY